MKIKNNTQWDTADMRKIFSKCIYEIKKIEGRRINNTIEIRNNNIEGNMISGRATIGGSIYKGYWMMIKIGIEIDFDDFKKRKELALMFIHEYYHNLGYKDQDRCNYKYDWTKDINVDFVKDCQIKLARPKIKPKRNLQLERYNNVMKHIKEAERKLKRWQKIVKKWKAKQRYYENSLIAANKIKSK